LHENINEKEGKEYPTSEKWFVWRKSEERSLNKKKGGGKKS